MELTQCIITRVSHDLVGISGALYNTVELLEIDTGFVVEGTGILKETTRSLNARLKFFRALFGTETSPIDTALANAYFKTLSAQICVKGEVQTQLQLGCLLICADALPRGGEIEVDQTGVYAAGLVKLDSQIVDILEGRMADLSPKTAVAAWLMNCVHQKGKRLVLVYAERGIGIKIQ